MKLKGMTTALCMAMAFSICTPSMAEAADKTQGDATARNKEVADKRAKKGAIIGATAGAATGVGMGAAIGGIGVAACGTAVGIPVGVVCIAAGAAMAAGGAATGAVVGRATAPAVTEGKKASSSAVKMKGKPAVKKSKP